MTPEDLHYLRAVGRAAAGGTDYFGSFAEIRGAHYRRGYDGELFHILAAEVVEAVHRASGDAQRLSGTHLDGRAVRLPDAVAHAMRDYHGQHEDNELLIFHNHPYNPLNFLLDNLPLPSRTDRLFLELHALNTQQCMHRLLRRGHILFYLGENGFVREFCLPSIVALFDCHAEANRQP